ncbi:methylcytosine dioxygenase TET3 [Pholidichthys leucotaenia]
MEIGSHDCLQEGALSLKLANGVNPYPNDDDDDDEASMETEQQSAGSVPPRRRCWVPGRGKVSDGQQQQPCWNNSSGATPGEQFHHAVMEDAHNLVAFSAIAGSLPPSSSSSCLPVQPNIALLYEKFTRETGVGEAHARPSAGTPEGGCQTPDDLETLQTALSQAKHGHKPPNCNCDGPECPDYLEWLEKKIKLATSVDQGSSKIAATPPHSQAHPQQPHSQHHPQPHQQLNGGHHLSPSCSQQQQVTQDPHQDCLPCSKRPIPCSPQVLSIAKEKNISLQTAIAIDALTQLSGAGSQAVGSRCQTSYKSNLQHHQNTQNITSNPLNGSGLITPSPDTHLSSSRSQSVPPGLHTAQQAQALCEHHRPQSQGPPPHAAPLPSSTSPFPSQGKPPGFSPNAQQWDQGSGRGSDQRNSWMCMKSETNLTSVPRSNPDPMSELKQLLGDPSCKFSNAHFKLPASQQLNSNQIGGIEPQDNPASARIKQESDSDEQYHHTASMGHYGMANGQQQGQHYPGAPVSPGQAAISHSTQAALQQHLHYKRNLFSNHSTGCGAPGQRGPLACQNLKKWWPQMQGEGLAHLFKQEPKKKKISQGSSGFNAMSERFIGPPLPKPKQIIIKKTKQKASMPTFLPQSQITIQKPPVLMRDRAPAMNCPQAGAFPSLPLHSNTTQAAAAAGLPAPAQSQVSIFNSPMTPSSTVSVQSENAPALTGPLPPPATQKSEDAGNLAFSNTSTATPVTSTSSPITSKLQNVINVDPRYEELIRQLEAEFGESNSDTTPSQPMEKTATALQPGIQIPTSHHQDLSASSSSASNPVPSVSTTQVSATHPSNGQEINRNESGMHCETNLSPASRESHVERQHKAPFDVSLQQEALVEKQLLPPTALEDRFSMPCSPLPKRMKIEASGDVTVLSTTCFSEEGTPTKDSLSSSPSLRGFLESPLRYLETPTKNLLNTPSKDLQPEFPICTCVEQIVEKDEGPYYNHLGSGPTVASIRSLMEMRFGEKGDAVRIEKVMFTGKEGKSSHGCPIAKWVIRRSSEKEKLLCLVRERAGHRCENAVIVVVILAWEGVPKFLADKLYRELSDTLTKYGNTTSRRCGLNEDRTCACQGKDPETAGASFSFGCSWSMYFNGCKYARSKMPRKFRLQGDHPEEEEKLRDNFQHLATEVAPLYKRLAPQAYSNQCQTEQKAPECRLGLKEGRPFSGVTACMDFCAHAHKDQHNLHNGCTVVCTLTKEDNRKVGEIPDDEQLHVLPLYILSRTDEFGSELAQQRKMQTGAIQVLNSFRREVRKLPEPAKSCRQRRLEAKKAASEKKKNKLMQQAGDTPEKTVIKAEVCLSSSPRPQGNKAVIKQEVKTNIKSEPFNGSLEGYPLQSIYPNPAFYARGGLPPTGQPSAPEAVNGYHPSLPSMPYGYYSYPPNALFPPKMRTYEGRNGSLAKAGSKAVQADKKPDIRSIQARLSCHPEQPNQPNDRAYVQPTDYSQSRPPSASSERGTPLIKQEPMDVPLYESTLPTPAGTNTSRSTSQSAPWPGQKLNGSIVPNTWDSHLNHKKSTEASSVHQEKQQFHQHPQQQQQLSSPYPQQWTSHPSPSTPVASPAPSPSLQVPPSPTPSPHLGTALQANVHQDPTHPATPRPSTPHPGTPQHGGSHSSSITSQPATPRAGTPIQWASPASSPQPNAWAMSPAAYSPSLKHNNPAGAYPDKIWSKTGESRCSTPVGLQEKVWKSFGGSVANSTPSPAPEGRLFPDALQQSDQAYCNPSHADSDAESTKYCEEDEDEVWSDSEHNFLDPRIGGVAVAPAHGSILFECARRELHATTPLKKPDRSHPTRISLVFYQHKNLNQPMHGLALWEAKMKLLAERALQRQQEAALLGLSQEDIKVLGKKRKWGAVAAGASPGPGQSKDKKEGPMTRLSHTYCTTSIVTVSPYAFTCLTGPYSHFV